MSKVQFVLFYLALLSFICRCRSLVELPPVEDNSIMETEAAIRNTINQIFSLLKLEKAEEKTKLKQYSQIHNYFSSVTLKDYKNLKEIAQLTRVDNKNVDNTTLNFIALINAILNADSFAENEGNNVNPAEHIITDDAANYLQSYLNKLNYFDETVSNSPRVEVNEEAPKILERSNIEDHNITETTYYKLRDEDNNILDNNEFWQPTEETRRIYKGKRTRIKRFPFMAVILFFNVFQCAGSIIYSDLVVTAASCLQLAYNNRLYRENPSFLSVRVGSNFHNGGGEVVAVMEVFFHPSYNPKTLRNNIAVLRLVRHLKLTSSRVKKIAIDKIAAPLPSNTPGITIIGWGATSASNVVKSGFVDRLTYAILDIYDLRDCQDVYSKEYVTRQNFCAGFISKGSGACNHDVGGPGVASGVLRGVVSFGSPHCGTPDAPTVFTKVGFYVDWIEDIMEQDVPRGRRLSTLRTTFWVWPTTLKTTTDYTITPVPASTTLAEFLPLGTTTGRPIGRQKKKVDMKLFREFLKTVLNGNEIDEYLDQFMRNNGIRMTSKTDDFTAVEFVTKNINVEPETVDYAAEWTTERVTHAFKEIEAKNRNDAEKELENEIVELINDADLREILLESVSTATMPPLTQKTNTQMQNKTKKRNVSKIKGKKIEQIDSEQDLSKQQSSKVIKKSVKKNKAQKDTENMMNILYLTIKERDQTKNPKINNKEHDDSRVLLKEGLSKNDQAGQDIVLYMTQEEIYDDNVDDNNKATINSDDIDDNNKDIGGNYNINELTFEGQEQQDIADEEIFQEKDRVENVVSAENQDDTDIDEVVQKDELKGINMSLDIPSIPEVPANPAPLQRSTPAFQSQIPYNFRAVSVENKIDALLESNKMIVDILNEVMTANKTNVLPNDIVPTVETQVSYPIVDTANNNQNLK